MKTGLLLGLVAVNLSGSDILLGQSTFEFDNFVPTSSIDAPIFDAQGVPLAGSDYLAELFGGVATNSLARAISFGSRVMVSFLTGPGAGYFQVAFVEIPSVPGNGLAWLQVKAWDARLGATYEEVASRGLGGYGESSLFFAQGGSSGPNPTLPGPLLGLQSFSLREVVPEPSAALLLLLALPWLLFRKSCRK